MESYFDDAYQLFRSAKDEYELFEKIASFAERLGFEYCCYGIRMPLPVSKPTVAIFDTYPPGWMTHYHVNRFLDIDPTVRAGMRSADLIVWPQSTHDEAQRLWSDARDFGIKVGVAHPSWTTHGAFGLLTMSRHADPLTPAEIEQLQMPANWLSNVCHMLMSQFLQSKLAAEASIMLTAREREVLRWTGDGKTSYEIGKILSISERTVNFHVNNVLSKLAATNKVQAVVKAIATGLI
ncbi:autoinducer binding domain-containing protein [Paraburkholderia sp. DD10]|uniref:LuxR family quorum-sensing system transcriptional regulator SolR n=1 Tax=Paraburkholderia terricola TaxID=169427 RepID=A0ABU1LYG5_9BURK|nr:autoinducer binding domain-containing protein [Paraburkholderia terricola]AXE94931.1 LuxR family transcriptional regulator [Paraburkholderia terricola]MDR6411798.1 LuxR family quorum-sensing system transcriptional regulator SolR [Paraburkholderia terricola]MDR6484366.1 LuxR family quorum-sensing system transcriptional regulator SolR [Paraburkholderia terricola]